MDPLHQELVSETLEVNRESLLEIVGLVEELVINKVRLEKIRNENPDISQVKVLDQELRIISEIQSSIKKIGQVKLNTIQESLEAHAHACCAEEGIHAAISFEGMETEVENAHLSMLRKLLEILAENMIINAFQNSRAPGNFVKYRVRSDCRSVTVIIESNGKGIDPGEISQRTNQTRLEMFALGEGDRNDFLQGIRYRRKQEQMGILMQELIDIGGDVGFETGPEGETLIYVELPLVSSIMQGMLVMIGNQNYAVPTDYIESIVNTKSVKKKQALNREMIVYLGQAIPLLDLAAFLGILTSEEPGSIVIVNADNKKAAFLVDAIIDQTDMVIKPKHSAIREIREFSGTTILGDGLVTLVLDVPSIIQNV